MGTPKPRTFGLLLFPHLTQLDLTGPYEVFRRVPEATVCLVWKNLEPVRAAGGLSILPTCSYGDHPPLDVLCVPGGPGQVELMNDVQTLKFLQETAARAELVTSVCTGSLVLGAAGLLQGYEATSHWSAVEQLSLLGATPVRSRTVWDRNRVTGAGVTSGIDFALDVVKRLYDESVARIIQYQLEYEVDASFPLHPKDAVLAGLVEKSKTSALALRRMDATRLAAQALKQADNTP